MTSFAAITIETDNESLVDLVLQTAKAQATKETIAHFFELTHRNRPSRPRVAQKACLSGLHASRLALAKTDSVVPVDRVHTLRQQKQSLGEVRTAV